MEDGWKMMEDGWKMGGRWMVAATRCGVLVCWLWRCAACVLCDACVCCPRAVAARGGIGVCCGPGGGR